MTAPIEPRQRSQNRYRIIAKRDCVRRIAFHTLGWNGPQLLTKVEFGPCCLCHLALALDRDREQPKQWAEWVAHRFGRLPKRSQFVVREDSFAERLLANQHPRLEAVAGGALESISLLGDCP